MTTGLAELLTARDAERVWRALPLNAFVRLDRTATFARSHPLVVVKTREFIRDVPPTESELGQLVFARMDLIACGGVPCAYVITSPRCRLRVRVNHLVLSARGAPVSEPQPLFADGTLGVVGDQDAIVGFVRQRHWLPPPKPQK